MRYHLFYRTFSYILTHTIVDLTRSKDKVWFIAKLLCFMCKIVRIYSNTVSTNKTWSPRFANRAAQVAAPSGFKVVGTAAEAAAI